MKEISIIIPCYNCSEFIAETIKCLEKQTFKEFEVICINDGSNDDTLNKLYQIKETTCLDIKILTQKNCGVSKTRNRGITIAEGRYILFLDSDDIYNKNFVSYMLTAIKETDADCVYCRLSRKLQEVETCELQPEFVIQNQKQAMDNLLFKMAHYGFYCYLYKKEVLIKNKLVFDENTKYFEDREFNWKYLCLCDKFTLIDAPLYGYRSNPNSALSKKTPWEDSKGSLDAVKRIEKYLEEHNCGYLDTLKNYLFARVLWGIAKRAASNKDKEKYARLMSEYDVKACMKITSKDKNKLVKIASYLYLIHPKLFYFAVGLC